MSDIEERAEPSDPVARAASLVDLGIQAANAYGREDLVHRLRSTRERLDAPDVRVLVVGEFKQGKSTLINALLNSPVCPVDDDVATSVPTIVRHGADVEAVVYYEPVDGADGADSLRSEVVPVTRLADYASEVGNPSNERGVAYVEIRIPRQLLETGLSLVDTPGVAGLGSAHGRMTAAVLPSADAVILVSDASQEYTEPELSFLAQAAELCPTVVCVVSKIDLYPEWRKITELDARHLEDRGYDVPVLPLSAALRRVAVEGNDAELNAESGFSALVSMLRDQVLTRAHDLAAGRAATDILFVASQLEGQFAGEREILTDPETSTRVVDRLEQTKKNVEELRSKAARWQTTLADGAADLNADTEHDLRARIRTVQKTAEDMIDDGDPVDMWAEFEPWIEQAVATEVTATYRKMYEGIEALATQVAEHFGDEEELVLADLLANQGQEYLAGAAVRDDLEFKRQGALGQTFSALRGSYGGFLMFSMASQMVGLAALNPAVGVLTLLVGRKSVREEKDRQLAQRRVQAKQAVRTYIDDVNFPISKDVRDTLRRVQRRLRDSFQARAEELQRSTNDALTAAQAAAQQDASGRQARLRDVDAELERIRWLRQQAEDVGGPAASGRSGS